MYISDDCQWTPYGTNPELDKQVDNDDYLVRLEVAKQGYGLDKLVYDENWQVCEAVAKKGYGLDILVNNKSWVVRCAVAHRRYGLDKLVNDSNKNVRYSVAYEGYGLDILINDESYAVRREVACQDYGLDKLINDNNWYVRVEVEEYLKEHNLTLEQWIEQNPNKCVLNQNKCSIEKVTKDFIYKIDESNKLEVQSHYNSVDEFFSEPIANDIKLDTLIICSVDTKLPLIKLEKVKNDNIINYRFIVDITLKNGDSFNIKSTIETNEQLTQKIKQTIDALNGYPEFSKYADELENCII